MLRSLRVAACAAALVLLSACAGDAQTRATASLAIACDSIATALDQAAPLRAAGKLSAVQVASITRVRDAAAPFCASDSVVDPAVAVAIVETSARQIRALLN